MTERLDVLRRSATKATRANSEGTFPPADARTDRPEEGNDDERGCRLDPEEAVGSPIENIGRRFFRAAPARGKPRGRAKR